MGRSHNGLWRGNRAPEAEVQWLLVVGRGVARTRLRDARRVAIRALHNGCGVQRACLRERGAVHVAPLRHVGAERYAILREARAVVVTALEQVRGHAACEGGGATGVALADRGAVVVACLAGRGREHLATGLVNARPVAISALERGTGKVARAGLRLA